MIQPDYVIWVDLNISPVIAKWIEEELSIPARSNYQIGLTSVDDLSMFIEAKKRGNIIILTKDTDFPDLVTRYGDPPKVIYLKVGNRSNKDLWMIIKESISEGYQILTKTTLNLVEIS